MNSDAAQRIDKWLWFARFFKTRSLAAKYVVGGKIRLKTDNQSDRIKKSSHLVKPNDILTFPLRQKIVIVRVLSAGKRRGPPSEAQLLFEDLTPEVSEAATRAQGPSARTPGLGRPTKRDRRALARFTRDAS